MISFPRTSITAITGYIHSRWPVSYNAIRPIDTWNRHEPLSNVKTQAIPKQAILVSVFKCPVRYNARKIASHGSSCVARNLRRIAIV